MNGNPASVVRAYSDERKHLQFSGDYFFFVSNLFFSCQTFSLSYCCCCLIFFVYSFVGSLRCVCRFKLTALIGINTECNSENEKEINEKNSTYHVIVVTFLLSLLWFGIVWRALKLSSKVLQHCFFLFWFWVLNGFFFFSFVSSDFHQNILSVNKNRRWNSDENYIYEVCLLNIMRNEYIQGHNITKNRRIYASDKMWAAVDSIAFRCTLTNWHKMVYYSGMMIYWTVLMENNGRSVTWTELKLL